jgi:hypothetical protein
MLLNWKQSFNEIHIKQRERKGNCANSTIFLWHKHDLMRLLPWLSVTPRNKDSSSGIILFLIHLFFFLYTRYPVLAQVMILNTGLSMAIVTDLTFPHIGTDWAQQPLQEQPLTPFMTPVLSQRSPLVMVPASPQAPLVTKVAVVACQGLYHSTSLCQLGEHRSQKSIHKIVLFCLRPPSTVEMLFGGHISPCSPTFGITYHEQCCNCPNQSL